MTAKLRAIATDLDFQDFEIDVEAGCRTKITLTIRAVDGTALVIDDIETISRIHTACERFLETARCYTDADEDYAHRLNNWLDKNLRDDK